MDTVSKPGATFTTREQARDWVLDLVVSVREMRLLVNAEKTPAGQRRLYRKLLLRYGSAKGALDALYRTGHVDDVFHTTVSGQLLIAIAEKVTA